MSAKTRTGDYEVGYGKPPVQTRFQPGQSGNPRGRPKRVPTLPELVQREAKRRIVILEDGEHRKVTKIDALAKRLFQEALKGNARSTQQVIQLLAISAATKEAASESRQAQNETDQALLKGLFERLQEVKPPGTAKKKTKKRPSPPKRAAKTEGTSP